MTYPEPDAVAPMPPGTTTSIGLFTKKGKDYDAIRSHLAATGIQWFHRCQNERTRQERQWYINLAFFYGNQHSMLRSVSAGTFDLYTPKAPYYRVRIVINQIRKIIRKEISRLTAQKPNAYVMPASSEDQDVFAAQAGEQIWDSLWRRLKFNKTLREAIFWQAVCGNGFIKSYWDATAKDPDSQEPGDIKLVNVNPFYIFVPDLMCTELEDQPYLIHAQIKNNSWIKQVFGVDIQSDAKLESVDEAVQNVMGISRSDAKKDQSIMLEVWVKPGYLNELPDGGMFTIAGSQIVQGFDTWPYEHGQYPFAKLDAMQTGKFYNASIIEDLIPLQKELNRTRAQLIEAKNRMAKPQIMAQKGSVDPRKMTSEPGQIIEVAVGFDMPTPLPLQNLPSYVTDEINRLYTDLSDLSGQHEVSNGSTPPGVTAATAISFLQEQDESLIAPQYTSVEEAIEKIAGQSLSYVHMFWSEPRTVKLVGTEGTFDAQTFKGADLRGNVDIRIEAGSALPQSRAAKQAFLMDLMKMGFIPPDDGLEMMEIGGIEKIYEKVQIDKRQAQRENLKMRVVTQEDLQQQLITYQQSNPAAMNDVDEGLPLTPPLIVPVNTWDNHEIHIEVHNNYRKSQNFESVDPTVKAIFEAHVRQHMEASANMMLHPLTGMTDSNPNSPDPEDEQAQADEMMKQGPPPGDGNSPGPVPMPETDTGSSQGGSESG